MAQLVQFGGDVLGLERRRGGDEVKGRVALLVCRAGRLQHQLQDGAVAGVFRELFIERDRGAGLDLAQHRRQRVPDQLAAVLYGAGHQIAHLAIGALELTVENDRQRNENSDQRHQLERERCADPAHRVQPGEASAILWRLASGNRTRGSSRWHRTRDR